LALERVVRDQSQRKSRPVLIEANAHFAVALLNERAEAVAVMPSQLARWFDDDLGAARCLNMAGKLTTWPVYAAHLRSRQLSSATTIFVDCLKSASRA
jgi:DNA-binding transcriptional LysR family regulator